ncbi:YkgJ family cysteine cluster protein [Candidatus Chloroploca sp. Khr17]|uniref:YkgJ family cysteine cluster protein n=1 Tax=Candidatus Chloroploca sp. Khr17 TaxID=2496869 RepID=UPI00101BF79E|nr:YkgJ family cysteine cluster protein [Candidatus Chloroploca sp. Khr17]
MSELTPVVASPAQGLCVRCGLCCDGTIFAWARLTPEDDLARLEAGGFIVLPTKTGTGFAQPCHHHHDRVCTIYQEWRPSICHAFRCQLLRRFDAGEISLEQAHVTITQTTELADLVWAQLRERVGEVNGSLKELFRAWEATQHAQDAAWRRQHAAFLLDYASLQLRLDRNFRLKPGVVESTEMKGNERA